MKKPNSIFALPIPRDDLHKGEPRAPSRGEHCDRWGGGSFMGKRAGDRQCLGAALIATAATSATTAEYPFYALNYKASY